MMSCFIDHEDSIYNYKPEIYQTRRSTVAVSNTTTQNRVTKRQYTTAFEMEKHWAVLPQNME